MEASVKGSYQLWKTHVIINLDIIIFTEGNSMILYCPALDLSGYGMTEQEAYESFKTVLSEYFKYTLNKSTLKEDLQKMGWKIRSKYKPMQPPTLQRVLRDNDNFNRIFNSFDFRKTVTQIELPVVA